jgi:lipopolysaccharide/colanic/teichoic acid biosynthesis glycosyltransferase
MQVFNRQVSGRGLTVFGFETLLVSGSLLVAAHVHGSLDDAVSGLWKIVLITAVCELCFYYNDLYDLTVVHSKSELFIRVLQAAGAASITLAVVSVLMPSLVIGGGIFLTSLALLLVAVPAWRLAFEGLTRDPHLKETVLIVGKLPTEELLHAKLSGVRVEDAATTYERITGKIMTDGIKPSWLIFSDGFCPSRGTRIVKRIFDLVLSLVGLALAAPLMLLTAVAVRLDSPGPVLYRQDRVGENGRLFTLSKFRSMRADAESGTPIWAKDRDDRVTRVGRFIRLARLDELPQLWNVLRGDMSFVGPRPERPFFVEPLAAAIPFYMERHAVKPGVTGWAQVKYRYGSSIEDATEKLRYDLYYIKHLSIVFDLTIMIDTVKVILSGKGAK